MDVLVDRRRDAPEEEVEFAFTQIAALLRDRRDRHDMD